MIKSICVGFCLSVLVAVNVQPASAVETYTDQQQQEFVSWCTGEKSLSETVCSCTVQKLALTVPATALTQFLSSQGSFSLSAAAVSTGATVTQALLTCNS